MRYRAPRSRKVLVHQNRDRHVVWQILSRTDIRNERDGDEPRNNGQEGNEDLREGTDQRRPLSGRQVLRRQRTLHFGEVCGPVTEGEYEAQTHHDADPVAEGIGPVADCCA
jgi:hypothetical protein